MQESGQGRIWHLFVGSQLPFEMDHGCCPATGMKPLPDATVYEQNPLTVELPLGSEMLPPKDVPVKVYSIDYGWSAYPAVPVPYETFAETFSYGPEPFVGQN